MNSIFTSTFSHFALKKGDSNIPKRQHLQLDRLFSIINHFPVEPEPILYLKIMKIYFSIFEIAFPVSFARDPIRTTELLPWYRMRRVSDRTALTELFELDFL